SSTQRLPFGLIGAIERNESAPAREHDQLVEHVEKRQVDRPRGTALLDVVDDADLVEAGRVVVEALASNAVACPVSEDRTEIAHRALDERRFVFTLAYLSQHDRLERRESIEFHRPSLGSATRSRLSE